MRRVLFLVLIAALWAPAVSTQQPLAGFDAYVAKAMKDWRTPGLAIAVVKDGVVPLFRKEAVRKTGIRAPFSFYRFSTRTILTQPLAAALCTLTKPSFTAPITTSSSPLARVASGLLPSAGSASSRTLAIFGASTSPSLKTAPPPPWSRHPPRLPA